MATGQGEVRGSASLIDLMLMPRPITRLGLIAAGTILAALTWQYAGIKLIQYLSGVLGPFCIACATVVWGLRDKADLVLDGDHLSADAFQSARRLARELRARSLRRSAWACIAALAAASPAIAATLTGTVWQWMVFAAGIATAEAIYSYLIAAEWEEQLRAQRDNRQWKKRLQDERLALEARIEEVKLETSHVSQRVSGELKFH